MEVVLEPLVHRVCVGEPPRYKVGGQHAEKSRSVQLVILRVKVVHELVQANLAVFIHRDIKGLLQVVLNQLSREHVKRLQLPEQPADPAVVEVKRNAV